ncbi:hypothetical protein P9D39_16265 [Heyndrickxia oleronia]|uniref:Uncharacterized protein n=1 Tax=Heyndrickxia oleronia TaxID=38875 RepID=A0A8E2ID27_9BACI|nr:hypothetical protein [Heyndrickxia oleronia]MEC1375846.1 hypothetical protein [Heyndrickxia oleronia]OOP67711.1 hypothetical protein BWZ43_14355 [Heyndrickxia oleronia]QQZ05564.1 hypothetical protein I5818_03445 [Heyndrickxia oleronia]
MSSKEHKYSINDLAKKHYRDEKTIRNYIDQMADVFGFDKESLKTLNEKGNLEYSLNAEQEQLISLLIQGIDNDPYLKRKQKIQKVNEEDVKRYRNELVERIEHLSDEGLIDRIKNFETFQLGQRLKDIHDEKEEIHDAFLFLIEHISLKERIEIEEKLLERDKKITKHLMGKFIKQIAEQAYHSITQELEGNIEEKGWDLIANLPEEQLINKVEELLQEKFKEVALINHNFAGYNSIEKTIGELLKNTTKK